MYYNNILNNLELGHWTENEKMKLRPWIWNKIQNPNKIRCLHTSCRSFSNSSFLSLMLWLMLPNTSLFHLDKSLPQQATPLANPSKIKITSFFYLALTMSSQPVCRTHMFWNLKGFLTLPSCSEWLETWNNKRRWSE